MSGTRPISRTATRERHGLSHVSRLVELWLAHYGLNEDDTYENDFAEKQQQSISRAIPVVNCQTQGTFGFYQAAD